MAEGYMQKEKTKCQIAIEYVSSIISCKFPRYPEFANEFQRMCVEEAFEDIDVVMDDFADGFDESVILEAVSDEIYIEDEDKERLCSAVHNILSAFVACHIAGLQTNYTNNDIENMHTLVSKYVKLLKPNHKDPSMAIYITLIIGQKNNIPLLTYLINSYHRKKQTHYVEYQRNEMLTLQTFCTRYFPNNQACLLYQDAMKSCIHRHGLFYCNFMASTTQQNISKVYDSWHIFCLYSIAVMKAVNHLLKACLLEFPTQIDVWIIPKAVKGQKIYGNEIRCSLNYERLQCCDNLLKKHIARSCNDINKLTGFFVECIQSVLDKQARKRMVMIVDRTHRKYNHDVLYGYLPPNTQDVASADDYLYESMLNLTNTEILPCLEPGEINDNTISANSENTNMFILSLHLNGEKDIAMYWHYIGSCTRFYVEDMVTLWPLHFVSHSNEENHIIHEYIVNKDHHFDEIIDVNFIKFYKTNIAKNKLPGDPWTHDYLKCFRYIGSEFDENGLLYFLGSDAKRKMYENPCRKGHVEVSVSSLDPDSKRKIHFVGRSRVGCITLITRNRNSSWMSVYLKSVRIKATHYTLKHCNSQDDALRNWSFEGSKNGKKWVVLKNHRYDVSLQNPGDTKTWGICTELNDYFCRFRIILTGLNSSGRWCLGCSGIEIYGNAFGGLVSESQMIGFKFEDKLDEEDSKEEPVAAEETDDSDDGKMDDAFAKDAVWKEHNIDDFMDQNQQDQNLNMARNLLAITSLTRHEIAEITGVNADLLEEYESLDWSTEEDEEEDEEDEEPTQSVKNTTETVESEQEKMKKDLMKQSLVRLKKKCVALKISREGNKKDIIERIIAKIYAQEHSKTKDVLKEETEAEIRKNYGDKPEEEKYKSEDVDQETQNIIFRWDISPEKYEKCVKNNGTVIWRQTVYEIGYPKQFMFGSSFGIKSGVFEFKIKYETQNNNTHCCDAVGIMTDIEQCRLENRWITNWITDEVSGMRYIYHGDGKIYCISENANGDECRYTHNVPHVWKSGQILTVRVHCNLNGNSFIYFFIDDEQIANDIVIKYKRSITYYPVLSTQTDDTKFTLTHAYGLRI